MLPFIFIFSFGTSTYWTLALPKEAKVPAKGKVTKQEITVRKNKQKRERKYRVTAPRRKY